MGLYDKITVYMNCPYCNTTHRIEAQTKDLNKQMHNHRPLRPEQEDMIDREDLQVFPNFHKDKSHEPWDSQQEQIKAQAKIPEDYKDLDHIDVKARCTSTECMFDSDREGILTQGTPTGAGKPFNGKIKIDENGYLTGKIVDIEKPDYYNKDLSQYKKEYPETFEKLRQEYNGHEPLIVRNWPNKPEEDK